jgi:hydrogenase 3 maturation protease
MSLEGVLAGRLHGEVVVVAVGNVLRGDDAAAVLLARALRPAPGLRVVEAEDAPERHLGAIVAGRPAVIVLVDAVDCGAAPAGVALLELADLLPYAAWGHRVPLAVIGRWLEQETAADVFVLAIQPARTGWGVPASREVTEAVGLLAGTLNRILAGRKAPAEHRGSLT